MNSTVNSQDVADWLNTLDNTSAIPVIIKIGRTEYVGAYYTQLRKINPSTRAYFEGKREYYQNAFYLLGDLPASCKRSNLMYYRFSDGKTRMYVSGWFDQDLKNEYHPFGRMFQLFPFDYFDAVEKYRPPKFYEMEIKLVSWNGV